MSRWPFQRKQPAAADPLSQAKALVAQLLQFTPEDIAKAASTQQGRKQLGGVVQELQSQLSMIEPMFLELRGMIQRIEAAIAKAEGGVDA